MNIIDITQQAAQNANCTKNLFHLENVSYIPKKVFCDNRNEIKNTVSKGTKKLFWSPHIDSTMLEQEQRCLQCADALNV